MSLGVALIQHDIIWNEPDANIAALSPKIIEAKAQGAQLVVCAEMCTTGFSLLNGSAAAQAYRKSTTWLTQMARSNNLTVVGSVPGPSDASSSESAFDKPTNRLVAAKPSGELVYYDKAHLFSFADEGKRYSAGTSQVSFTLNEVRITPFICYDLRFPVPFARKAHETDLFLLVANWPTPRIAHWRTLLQARAIENQAYVIGVNRIGSGGGLAYCGSSLAYAPDGSVLASLDDRPTVTTVQIDAQQVSRYRNEFPTLKDRGDLDAFV